MTRERKPKAPPLLEGRDYYCGTCVSRGEVPCDYCVDGCSECFGQGTVKCPECVGGTVPVQPPVW